MEWNFIQALCDKDYKPTCCPLYWKMRGGDGYYGNMHYFTFLGIRIVISTILKKDLWTV